MDGVEKRIDLAALATVADIVPLMEENRVIVREGMMRMGTSARPGLKKLMELAQAIWVKSFLYTILVSRIILKFSIGRTAIFPFFCSLAQAL